MSRAADSPDGLRFRPMRSTLENRIGALLSLGAGAAYFIAVATVSKFHNIVELNPDEGNNAMKALLLRRGHRFFDEIWSDQPPLSSHLFHWAFEIFGWDISVARIVILFFASIIIFVCHDTVRRDYGMPEATGAALLLALSASFAKLSVSVMIGLPAIALAALGFWTLSRWSESRRATLCVLSGALFALSVCIKMFTAFVVPWAFLLVAGVAAFRDRGAPLFRLRGALGPTSLWLVAFLVAGALGMWSAWVAEDPLSLVRVHQRGRATDGWLSFLWGPEALRVFIKEDAFLYGLALVGLPAVLTRRTINLTWAGGWLVLSTAAIYGHRPVWPHHRLLLAVPAAIVAGAALGAASVRWRTGNHEPPPPAKALPRCLARWASVLLVTYAVHYVHPGRLREFKAPPSWTNNTADRKVVSVMAQYARKTKRIVTTRQMYAFALRKPVPPALAVTSRKRFDTDPTTGSQVLRAITNTRPEQVVISSRWKTLLRLQIRQLIRRDYDRVYYDRKNANTEVYVRRDLVERK